MGNEPKLTGGVVLQMLGALITQVASTLSSVLSGVGALLGGLF